MTYMVLFQSQPRKEVSSLAQVIVTLLRNGEDFLRVSQEVETVLHMFGTVSVNKGGGHALFTVFTDVKKETIKRELDMHQFPGSLIVGEAEDESEMSVA